MSVPKGITDNYPELSKRCILAGYRGSIAHGLYTPPKEPTSIDDKDVMYVCVPTIDYYFGLKQYGSHGTREIKKDEWDIVVYEALKFIRLLEQGNPNVLMMLWLEPNHYLYKSAAGQLICSHRQLFVGRHVYRSFTGYAYGQLHRMTHNAFQGHMGDKRRKLVERFGFDCYSEDTEFLTENGWKVYDDILDDDILGTINTKNFNLEFQKPTEKIKKNFTGFMYYKNTRYSSFCVTENHRMFVSPCKRSLKNKFSVKYDTFNSSWNFHSLKELLNGRKSFYHVFNSFINNNIDYNIDDDYLKLLGMYISEGSMGKFRKDRSPRCMRICQTTNGKNEFFKEMRGLKFNFKEYTYFRKDKNLYETSWMFYKDIVNQVYKDCYYLSKEKHFPKWFIKLSERQAKILLYNLMLGDGYFKDKKTQSDIYYTNNKILANQTQILSFLAGLTSTVLGPYYTKSAKSYMYQVLITKEKVNPSPIEFNDKIEKYQRRLGSKYYGKGIEKIEYSGDIVCFTVPNETLITRFNGKIAIHGNTKNAGHLIRLLRMGIEFLKDGQLHVQREDASQLLEIKRGEWPLEKILAESDRLFAQSETAYLNSSLPESPDKEAINHLAIDVIETAMGEFGKGIGA